MKWEYWSRNKRCLEGSSRDFLILFRCPHLISSVKHRFSSREVESESEAKAEAEVFGVRVGEFPIPVGMKWKPQYRWLLQWQDAWPRWVAEPEERWDVDSLLRSLQLLWRCILIYPGGLLALVFDERTWTKYIIYRELTRFSVPNPPSYTHLLPLLPPPSLSPIPTPTPLHLHLHLYTHIYIYICIKQRRHRRLLVPLSLTETLILRAAPSPSSRITRMRFSGENSS